MPAGQSSWIRRWMGLALSRHLLRRALAVQGGRGEDVLETVISTPVRETFVLGSPGRPEQTR
jgi:hypothetical protein